MSLSTPYYRTLALTHSLGCDDEPDFMYGPYNIFCMQTRLYPIVYKLYGRNVEMIFRGVHMNNRMEIKIELYNITDVTNTKIVSDTKIDIKDEKRKILDEAVNKIVTENSDYCLIDKNELYISTLFSLKRKYSYSWFSNILGYIGISTEFNPFLKKEGIYLSFNPLSDYKTAYNDVVRYVLNTLEEYYQNGVVYGAGNIAEKWKLERLDYEEVRGKLYQPMWSDNRFAVYPVDFLLEKIRGYPYIKLLVSNNLVKRHYVAGTLNKHEINFVFDGSYVKVPADDIDEAQYIAALVMSGKKQIEGKAITLSSNNLSHISLFFEAAKKILEDPDCTEYKISSAERPYVFSCVVGLNISSNLVLSKLRDEIGRKHK